MDKEKLRELNKKLANKPFKEIYMAYKRNLAVHPGHVRTGDGDLHYMTFSQLLDLYGLDMRKCVVWDDEKPETFRGRNPADYIHFYPRWRDDYEEHKKKLLGE